MRARRCNMNKERAYDYYQMAATDSEEAMRALPLELRKDYCGNRTARLRLAQAAEFGELGRPQDMVLAREWYLKAAVTWVDFGLSPPGERKCYESFRSAQLRIAKACEHGQLGWEASPEAAQAWYQALGVSAFVYDDGEVEYDPQEGCWVALGSASWRQLINGNKSESLHEHMYGFL